MAFIVEEKNKNKELFRSGKKYLVGGVNSPVRSFGYTGEDPIILKKGKGPRVWDENEKEYIDYVLSYGALMLGHAHPDVVGEVGEAINKGFSFGTTTEAEIELAHKLQKAIPLLEKVRFTNSGTEAVMGAVRLARGYTKRDKIIKFSGSYHGHADYLLAKSGSGLSTFNIPLSRGVPQDFIKHTLVVEYGNKKKIDSVFEKYGNEIAAVIVEPVGGNYGVVPPDIDFLRYLRNITKRNKSLLIFDEVITGFRFGYGSISQELGITPDILTLGKIIGGGLPVGAYGAREEIMLHLSPEGEVYQASTFGGNPVVMQAGLATLNVLEKEKGKYKFLNNMASKLAENVQLAAFSNNVDLKVTFYGTMFSFKFGEKEEFQHFYKLVSRGGVFLAPSEYEANFLSLLHTESDIDKTISVMIDALEVLGENNGR